MVSRRSNITLRCPHFDFGSLTICFFRENFDFEGKKGGWANDARRVQYYLFLSFFFSDRVISLRTSKGLIVYEEAKGIFVVCLLFFEKNEKREKTDSFYKD